MKKDRETSMDSENKSVLMYGDNLDGMKLLLKEFAGKVELVYIDPPFNTNQLFYFDTEKRNSISSKLDSEIAFSDRFTLEKYIDFLRERLILIKELLSDRGSIYLHIDSKMSHYVKVMMDEVFGIANFKNDITRIKCNPKNFNRNAFGNEKDVILFYAKNANKNIWNEVKEPMLHYQRENLFKKVDQNGNRYTTVPVHAPGETKNGASGEMWKGMLPPSGRHWRYSPTALDELDKNGLIEWSKNGVPRIIKYAKDHRGTKIQDVWQYKDPQSPKYPTQKNYEMLKMIVGQSSNEGGIVLDCFCGSGTTLLAAENTNRKWIGIDKSSIAIDVAREELKKASYKFLEI